MSKFKKIVLCLCAICFFSNAVSETLTMYWLTEDGAINQTTTCETGGDVILPEPPTKDGYIFAGWKKKFTPIEYIQFNGEQMIDTGIIPTTNTKFRVKLNMQAASGCAVVGYTDGKTTFRILNYDQQAIAQFDTGNPGAWAGKNTWLNDTTYDFLAGTKYIKNYETNTILTGQEQLVSTIFTDTIKIGSPTCDTYGKIYLLQIWDDDTMVRDLIPVLDPNDIPCMYDKISRQFFYNSGSGDFISDPIISE